jgi:hypothetical protein
MYELCYSTFLSDEFEELHQNNQLAEHASFPPSWRGSDTIAKISENASGQFIYAISHGVYRTQQAFRHRSP